MALMTPASAATLPCPPPTPPEDERVTLAEMAARATTLDERIARVRSEPPAAPPPQDAAATQELLAVWGHNIDRGTPGLFARRLAWDGLDTALVAQALQTPPPAPQPPGWVHVLCAAYGWGREPGMAPRLDTWAHHAAAAARARDGAAPLAFEELLLPLVGHARHEIERQAGQLCEALSETAHAGFERALLGQLSRICAQALYVAFSAKGPRTGSAPSESAPQRIRYEAFVGEMRTGDLLDFFRENAVAARLCATTTENFIVFVTEFLGRLSTDRRRLAEAFGPGPGRDQVVDVQVGISDAHDGGRGVVICKLAGGARIVYKPRPLALEPFFAALVRWCNDTGGLLQLDAVKVLPFANHGWLEWVAPAACDSLDGVRRFYRRCGMLLALIHGVHGSDFHSGNLLARGEFPLLIDAEGLLTHKFELEAVARTGLGANSPASLRVFDTAASDSVIRTMLLPSLKVTADGSQAVDLGGLGLSDPGAQTLLALTWCDVNTDAMRMAPTKVPVEQPRNLPQWKDAYQTAAPYVDEVSAGFHETYALLETRRDELLAPGGLVDSLAAQPVRFIFRNTTLYASLLERTLHPKFLRDGAARTVELDVLARPLLLATERPVSWPLLAEERRDLERMDVPLFSARADGCSVTLANGAAVPCFVASAVAEVRRKLLSLGPSDLRAQTEMIHAAFAAVTARALADLPPEASATGVAAPDSAPVARATPDASAPPDARHEAVRLARAVAARAQIHEGVPCWIAPAYHATARRHVPGAGRAVLLDGNAGVGLALAAAAAVAGPGAGDDLAELARAAFEPLCGPLDEVAQRLARGTWDAGIGTGVASCSYGLLRAGELLDAPHLLAAAGRWAELLSAAALPASASDDLLSGRAGALLLLLRLYAADGAPSWLTRATGFAEALMGRRVRDSGTQRGVWATRSGRVDVGLAHGQSGIGYALAEAAAVMGRVDMRDAALEALAHERAVLGTDLAGTADDEATAPWSRGATGIGLVRLALLCHGADAELGRDLDAALAVSGRHLNDSALSIGSFARIELLAGAAEPLSSPARLDQLRAGLAHLLAQVARQGHYRLGWHNQYQHPGLLQGLSGLAYAWARRAEPKRVRNLALFS
jgi:type 2 lantibiotic biosynthesis protein LanM